MSRVRSECISQPLTGQPTAHAPSPREGSDMEHCYYPLCQAMGRPIVSEEHYYKSVCAYTMQTHIYEQKFISESLWRRRNWLGTKTALLKHICMIWLSVRSQLGCIHSMFLVFCMWSAAYQLCSIWVILRTKYCLWQMMGLNLDHEHWSFSILVSSHHSAII